MPAIPAIIAKSGRQTAATKQGDRRSGRRIAVGPAPYLDCRSRGRPGASAPAGRYGCDELAMCSEKLGTGVEREPDAESLLTRRAFGSPQLLRDLRRPSFLARHCFQLTELA